MRNAKKQADATQDLYPKLGGFRNYKGFNVMKPTQYLAKTSNSSNLVCYFWLSS